MMQFRLPAVAGSAILLFALACGGGDREVAPPVADSSATAAAPELTTGGAVAAAPITGTVHEIRMVGDETGYRYEPATITAKPGDGVKFIMTSLGPHNVAFDPATIPADQKDQLYANMPNSENGVSPMLMDELEVWELSLGNLKPGRYPFYCTPHLAMNMTGEIIIQ